VFGLLLAAVGCEQHAAEQPDVEVRDSASVRIVHSLGTDRSLDWRLTEVFRLGGADAGPESFYKIERRGIKVGTDGQIHVLDSGNFRVVSFSSGGEHLRSFGSRGGGPGEIGVPAGLAVEPDGTVSVLDYRKRGLTRFAPDGSALDSRRIELGYSGDYMVYTSDGLLIQTGEGYRTEDPTVYDKVVLLKRDDSVIDIASLRRSRPTTVQYEGCVSVAFVPLFAPTLHWDANDDRIVVNDTSAYVIDIFRGLQKVASYRRDLPIRRMSREDALAELGKGKTVTTPRGKCRIDPEDELEGRGFAETMPAVSGLVLSPDGSVWVRRAAVRGEPTLIDVIDPNGRYLGTLPTGSPFPVAFVTSQVLIVEETDDLDIEYLVAYSIDSET
jgi:hypothetical protein